MMAKSNEFHRRNDQEVCNYAQVFSLERYAAEENIDDEWKDTVSF